MDDEDGDILNIQLSDTEVDENKADRTGQTEADFQAVKRDYRAKVENGHIHKHIKLPLGPAATKQHVQQVLHAVEELYFFRHFRDALNLIKSLQSDGSHQALDSHACKLILCYERKCIHKLNASS
ncbi:hypothetical protein G6O67_001024 [Ophiocordyceps sinensis]|uniref:Uncharacterized protein n=2 Tax=Ophiocordyceps sinensis TaxID=72228 RepID=A0A8H4PWQ9_9HYPO|nr:hypothetical protein OCS_01306 [Ophiocordyceps sinensis CO18]KAF4511816.1 hypothetical protein G6O67_001024 [Ophiocordyceps sinensis]